MQSDVSANVTTDWYLKQAYEISGQTWLPRRKEVTTSEAENERWRHTVSACRSFILNFQQD